MQLKRIIKARWLYWGYYIFGRGKSLRPSNITLEITYRCNLKCRMCLLYGTDMDYSRELSLGQWQKLIDEVICWRPKISLTGGEPFLRKDIVELVRYIKKRGLRCSINTNGVASQKNLKEVLHAGLDHLTFSIDGPEYIHDYIRGEKGAFKKMCENIRFVIRSRSTLPSVWGICVISKENVEHLDRLTDIAAELGLDGIQFQQVMFLDSNNLGLYQKEIKERAWEGESYIERLNHGQEELNVEILIEKVKVIKKKGKKLKLAVTFLPPLTSSDIRRYYKAPLWVYSHRCIIPWTNITIAPNGDVFPCIRLRLGNIVEDSVNSIWNGGTFIDFRKDLKRKGIFIRCRRCCHLGEI